MCTSTTKLRTNFPELTRAMLAEEVIRVKIYFRPFFEGKTLTVLKNSSLKKAGSKGLSFGEIFSVEISGDFYLIECTSHDLCEKDIRTILFELLRKIYLKKYRTTKNLRYIIREQLLWEI